MMGMFMLLKLAGDSGDNGTVATGNGVAGSAFMREAWADWRLYSDDALLYGIPSMLRSCLRDIVRAVGGLDIVRVVSGLETVIELYDFSLERMMGVVSSLISGTVKCR
jgi:hypothetical protein